VKDQRPLPNETPFDSTLRKVAKHGDALSWQSVAATAVIAVVGVIASAVLALCGREAWATILGNAIGWALISLLLAAGIGRHNHNLRVAMGAEFDAADWANYWAACEVVEAFKGRFAEAAERRLSTTEEPTT
jgi:uncharacterized membrane protein